MRKAHFKDKYKCLPMPIETLKKYLLVFLRPFIKYYSVPGQPNTLSCHPVFIISSGRSGTTLMRSMLVASGQVAIPAETQIMHKLVVKYKAYQGLGWQDLSRLMIAEFESHQDFYMWEINLAPVYQKIINLPERERSLARIVDEVYMTYAAEKFPNARVWGDQSPIHTFYLSYIDKIFPEAKYVHLLRDGRDVISSMVKRHGNDYLYEAVHRWKTSIKKTDVFQKIVGSGKYIEVRYEDLVQDSEVTLKRISQFINIEYTPRMLDYWKLPTTMEHKYNLYHQNLGKPVFTSSIGKWQERLSQEQQDYVMENISAELKHKGYLE